MSLHEQNRMIQILYKNGVNRNNVAIILEDLKKSGIFDDPDVDDDFEWDVVNQQAEIWFSDLEPLEKIAAIQKLDTNTEHRENHIRAKNLFSTEKRIQSKIKEMEELGLVESDEEDRLDYMEITTTRYGRTPLHEAIAMRNIRLVKKYIKVDLYLKCIDNNGHTPMEMAYYEGYREAMLVFKAHLSKKRL